MDASLQSRARELAKEIAAQATMADDLNNLMRSMMKSALERMLDREDVCRNTRANSVPRSPDKKQSHGPRSNYAGGVALLPHYRVRQFLAWWYRGLTLPWGYQIYFYVHLLLVFFLCSFVILDARGNSLLVELVENSPLIVRVPLDIVFLASIFSWPVTPFVSIRILYIARRCAPAFITLGVLDMCLSCLQVFVLFVARM